MKTTETAKKEITTLKEQLKFTNNILEGLVNILPFSVVIYDNNKNIILYNNVFLNIVSFKAKNDLIDSINSNIESILTPEIYKPMSRNISGHNMLLDKITIKNTEYLPSYYSICEGTLNAIIFREVSNKEFIKEEILSLLEHVVNSNHYMVKEIGHILGEESTKRTKALNSIINSIK